MNTNGKAQQYFIGFTSFANWLDAIDRTRPVHAAPVHERSAAGQFGLVLCTHSVIVAQIDALERVLYCRVVVDQYDSQDGVAPLFHGERHVDAARSAWTLTQAWLAEQGLKVWESVVAAPKELKLFNGDAAFMRFDRAGHRWVADGSPAVEDPMQRANRVMDEIALEKHAERGA